MGVVEDRPGCDREIVVAGNAVILGAVRYLRNLLVAASRAFNAIAPAQHFKVFAALIFVAAKLFDQRAEIHGVCHA
jgi:hypothetical protein